MRELCRPTIILKRYTQGRGPLGRVGLVGHGGELTNEASRITTTNTLHHEDRGNQVIQYLTRTAALLFQLIRPSSLNIEVYMNVALKVPIGADFR